MDNYAQIWADVTRDYNTSNREWIKELRRRGIKAAHPDDGWVNRVTNEVDFRYPQFNDGVNISDRISLGNFEHNRIVQINTVRTDSYGDILYGFVTI